MKRSILSLVYLIQGMHQAGIDLDDKLTSIGLRMGNLDPTSVLDSNLEKDILHILCADLAAKNGLNVGRYYTLAGYGPLLTLLVASPSIQVALNQAIQYRHFTHLTGQLEVKYRQNEVVIVYKPVQLEMTFNAFLVQCEMAATFKFIRDLFGLMQLNFPQVRVELPFMMPDQDTDVMLYREFYGENVLFNQSEACFCFDAQILRMTVPSFNPFLFEHYEQKCLDELKRLMIQDKKSGVVQWVKDYLALQHMVIPSMTETAKVLNISERTLRYQLQQQETSYKKIREEIMKDKALKMIEYQKYSIEMISELLGYSEPAAFNHAFKRWFGQSPSEFIKSLKSIYTIV
ncbi:MULTISPECIES: helix-turn-helix domain-containing protein [unclassified Acinetobacter]|uniref:helix-turn-helix domain-containing protein n=1 Tax=unclassified Acinetobacter TaxID=196816 RepID=UPI002934364F|nr:MULTISPECIES: AraC family transcriptional regulator ligand-binding domain-containing protein [unclassified Acinetobacter]WOE31871.1 AraC family transcriptional regulator ligand-binding domain-containing protein [Acinetobacter sp. SAAs470]WOE37338.1 AraC family transcriptional regulator ligand-binding domain-containing protein [Acinetobacter sp. SAAs474]